MCELHAEPLQIQTRSQGNEREREGPGTKDRGEVGMEEWQAKHLGWSDVLNFDVAASMTEIANIYRAHSKYPD